VYNALDPITYCSVEPDPRFAADLSFLENRLTDREALVELFFLEPGAALPERNFLIGGNGWVEGNAAERSPPRPRLHARA